MSGVCIEVPPRSTKSIRELAVLFRDSTGQSDPWFPIVWFMDTFLVREWAGYEFAIGTMEDMGGDAGRAYPDQRLVEIREDAYENAARGDGFGRFTMAHELGHLFMHQGLPMARHVAKNDIKPYRSSEWQANQFAAELLMPISAVQAAKFPITLEQMCGVSAPAARVRFEALRRETLI